MVVKIDYEKCCWKNGSCNNCSCKSGSNSCNGCVEACPVGAMERHNEVVVDAEKCIDCGACAIACPKNAITL
ncbi:hypothetical protein COX58_02680 [archaeon CG_4_10_14_0_2_um_filter_Archaea_38_6]|nr:MAG: hypothetical protein COS83_01660 [archaeon CG07_land_8_20_14_0_80_38_8]PIU89469.1 MAG: hypothetical protein COS64_00060 [archaeon CG06_land_8_20_14_3_00_37_11]PJA22181.1 MAG: hypothetical protein COX58_02680 [archaeon CG_4_10_14_0_2_um_filter_Archaea_38_6]